MEIYSGKLKNMTNEDLLDELVALNEYSPEDMTPADVVDNMINKVRAEILSRMI